jgi:hypothetical protein
MAEGWSGPAVVAADRLSRDWNISMFPPTPEGPEVDPSAAVRNVGCVPNGAATTNPRPFPSPPVLVGTWSCSRRERAVPSPPSTRPDRGVQRKARGILPSADGQSSEATHRAEVAQSVEHATENRGVASSILALGTTSRVVEHRAEVAQLVEHHLAKVRVAGSSPVFRSSILPEGPAAPSSSGRTADFGSVNRGSNPRGAASTA